jgi:hypothetical protein
LRGTRCAGAEIRSHVFSRSRCLIDLTTVGVALSKSKVQKSDLDENTELSDQGENIW